MIPNGVDFNLFKSMHQISVKKELGLDIKKKYILFVGDPLDYNKGFTFVNEAVKILKSSEKYRNIDFLLVCISSAIFN